VNFAEEDPIVKKLLIAATAGLIILAPLARGEQKPQWKLTKIQILGDAAPSGASSGLVTVYGLTAGYTDKANKTVYPTFVGSKSAVKAIHIYVDFVCSQTTQLGWVGIASGPVCLPMASDKLFSVTKNKVYRWELTLDGSLLAQTVPGLYDIYVSVVPNMNSLTPTLAGNGGMSTGVARMRLNN
jgi:hypothetical protein